MFKSSFLLVTLLLLNSLAANGQIKDRTKELKEIFYKGKLVPQHHTQNQKTIGITEELRLESAISQGWNETDWENKQMSEYTYIEGTNKMQVVQKKWENNEWKDVLRLSNTRNEAEKNIEIIIESFVVDKWVKSERRVASFNDAGNNTEVISQAWENNDWQNRSRSLAVYDDNQNETEYTIQNWDNAWVNSFRYLTVYNSEGTAIESVSQMWAGAWQNFERITNEWDETLWQDISIQYTWMENEWQPKTKIADHYNDEDLLLNSATSNWINGQWENAYYDEYVYDEAGNEIESISWFWDMENPNWYKDERISTEYDGGGEVSAMTFQQWGENDWVNSSREEYSTENNGFRKLRVSLIWDEGQWVNQSRDIQNFVIIVSVEDGQMPGSFSLKQNFPNPFNPSTTISFSLGNAVPSHVTLKVFDVLGKEVATLINGELTSGEHSINFNAGSLSSGTYFYRLESGAFTQTKKFVLMK